MARSGQFDPLDKFRFRIEIEGLGRAGFMTCSIPTESRGEITYREGHFRDTVEKSAGLTSYSDVTLARGVTDSQGLYEWVDQHKKHSATVRGTDSELGAEAERSSDEASNDYRKSIRIVALDREGNDTKSWVLYNAHVSEFAPGDNLDANAEEKLMESITIRHEGYIEEV